MAEAEQRQALALPLAPSLTPVLVMCGIRPHPTRSSRRLGGICVLSAGIAILAALAVEILLRLIAVITNLSWNGNWSLAPLITIGGCIGAWSATGLHLPLPVAVLVGMAAVFAGASHAVLASAIFVAEATGQAGVAGAALLASAVSWLVASRLIGASIMVEKIARRGVRVPGHQGDPPPRDRERVERAAFRLPRFWRRRGDR